MSEEKEKNFENNPLSKTKEIIFETTYEKVLFIINKVKEFIIKVSSTKNELIEELDWVIKVIASKSLYTYELVKEKLLKQNEEYDKYINFVKKYNEEIIEMNKKHSIVSGILTIRKKEEVLLKPSLFLKKMDNINILEEETPKNRNNFISTFGKYIINLYKEKNKKDVNEKKESNINNNSNNNNNSNIENKKENNKNIIDEIVNDNDENNENIINKNFDSKEEKKKENSNEKYNYIIPKQKKVLLEKEYPDKNVNFNINIQKIKISNKKMNFKSKSNSKMINPNSQEISRKKLKEFLSLSKKEKNHFNKIKYFMKNYYLNFAFNDQLISYGYPYLTKTDFNNIKHNNNINLMPVNNYFKRYKNNHEKTYNINKNTKQTSFPYNRNNKSKNNYSKGNKICLTLQINNEDLKKGKN